MECFKEIYVMKKNILLFFTILLGLIEAQAQFKIGVSGGLPVGDAESASTVALIGDMGYFFDVSDAFFIGVVTGYSFFLGDGKEELTINNGAENFIEKKGDNAQFVPVGLGFRWQFADRFSLGTDLGYAIGINKGNGGGGYYSPRAAYVISEHIDVVLAYRGIVSSQEEGYWDAISLGLELYID